MEFRARDYRGEEEEALPRVPIKKEDHHPLLVCSGSSHQVDVAESENFGFYDPLRGPTSNLDDHTMDVDTQDFPTLEELPSYANTQLSAKEWVFFKRSLMQKFSIAKSVSVSSKSDVIIKSCKAFEKPSASLHFEDLDDRKNTSVDGVKIITQLEYASRLRELKVEIGHAWKADDRVTSLKLSIKVARLLTDTCVSEFYPTLFILVTDVMDMLGDMVWERIKRKAEYADDGTIICSLKENFSTHDICSDAKETCFNWFCKIGSICELLPRIYLELAIFRCWRFLHEQPWRNLQRLVMMIRGLADPLASFYCRLYLVCCAQKLLPNDIGYLLACFGDMKVLLTSIVLEKETVLISSWENKKHLINLLEPTVEWILKCLCKEAYKRKQFENILPMLRLGRELSESSEASQCISIILHHFLKELPVEIVVSHSLYIVQLIECTNDISLNQYLNYRLLGLKLSEQSLEVQVDFVDSVWCKVFKVITQYISLEEYLVVADAFLDIILQYHMENYLSTILDGIFVRARKNGITESEVSCLQSVYAKLLTHFKDLEDAFAMNHFVEILHLMYGSSKEVVNMEILNKATRNGYIRNPTTIQLLFEVSQALHDGIDVLNIKDDYHKLQGHLISRFVQMVDYGAAVERHLTFLVECRGAFGRIHELKEVLVHSSNNLAIKALKAAYRHIELVKSCIAFNEVTIPSISAPLKKMNLYIETVEVAVFSGLHSHTDGLVDLAIDCLQSSDSSEGSLPQHEFNGVLSLIRKLCSLLVIIPGNSEKGVASCPRSILSHIESYTWITPQQCFGVYSAIVSLTTTLSQNKLPYHAYNAEVWGNDLLYFGDLNYNKELASLSSLVLTKMMDKILCEPNQVTRGNMALEACNCITSSFKATQEISQICSKLIEVAKSCLSVNDKYMRSTLCLLEKYLSNLPKDGWTAPTL